MYGKYWPLPLYKVTPTDLSVELHPYYNSVGDYLNIQITNLITNPLKLYNKLIRRKLPRFYIVQLYPTNLRQFQ